ncbi:hypothetical protein GALL_444630 [mine drainage metagenome]|uniref:Uncharacterized protein n=1 Tax=mine drainage metagenome TaxID=410659 RepID=A0A1J5Q1K4_9ZZZZ
MYSPGSSPVLPGAGMTYSRSGADVTVIVRVDPSAAGAVIVAVIWHTSGLPLASTPRLVHVIWPLVRASETRPRITDVESRPEPGIGVISRLLLAADPATTVTGANASRWPNSWAEST